MKIKSMVMIQYVICLGAFLSNLSAGLFNIALVDIAGDFHSDMSSTQWVVTTYLLTISVCLPLMGAVGDLRGKRNIHNAGFLIFMVGGLGCALSPNLAALIGFRVLQGIGASMYQANNMALIVSLFPQEKRGRALGTVSTFVAAGALIGPSLGGTIIQWFSWRYNFWLLAAAALGTWLLAQRLIPQDKTQGKSFPDLPGAGLFAIALTGLVTALNLGNTLGWTSASVWVLFTAFAFFGLLFVRRSLSARWIRNGRAPFIRLAMFNHPRVIFGILLTILTYSAAFATQIVLPVFLRSVMGLAPVLAGLVVMAYPASLIISAPLSGGSSDKYGSTPVMFLGLGCMVTSLLALSFLSPDSGLAYVIPFVVLLGCAMGMITSPNNSLVMSRTPKPNLGMMSSMIALSRNLGMMFGATVGGLVMSAAPTAEGSSARQLTRSFHGGYLGMAAVLFAALLVFLLIVWAGIRRDRSESNTRGEQESMV